MGAYILIPIPWPAQVQGPLRNAGVPGHQQQQPRQQQLQQPGPQLHQMNPLCANTPD